MRDDVIWIGKGGGAADTWVHIRAGQLGRGGGVVVGVFHQISMGNKLKNV